MRNGDYHHVVLVDVTAVRELFVRVTDGFDVEAPTLQVVIVTLVPEEFSVTQLVDGGGRGKLSTFQGSFGLEDMTLIWYFGKAA